MKAQQRQTLGVNDMYLANGGVLAAAVAGGGEGAEDGSSNHNDENASSPNGNGISRGGDYPYDSVISIHEIRLDDNESRQILPS